MALGRLKLQFYSGSPENFNFKGFFLKSQVVSSSLSFFEIV